jgi:hypothetical protein
MSHQGSLKRPFSTTNASVSENDGPPYRRQKRIQGSEHAESEVFTLEDEWTKAEAESLGSCCPRGNGWKIESQTTFSTVLTKFQETSEERSARESSEAAPWNRVPTIEEITTILTRATNSPTVESRLTASVPNCTFFSFSGLFH